MFDTVRSHRRWLMFFLVVLVFPSFVVTGVYSWNRFMSADTAVATIGGEKILPQQFEAAQRERVEQLRQALGANFDPKVFDSAEARAAVLDALLSERALAHEAVRDNIVVSEARLREVIGSIPAFQQDGKFAYDRYKTLLAAQGMNEFVFEQRVRDDLIRQTLLQAVGQSALVPKAVLDRIYRLGEEQREVRMLRFRPEDYSSKVTVTDEAINSFYQGNRSQFEIPESVKAEYVVLTLDEVAGQIAAPEAEIKAYYEQNQARLGEPEQRRASHILLTAGEGGTARDKDGARKKAEELLAKARANPSSFAQLAKENSKDPGSAANGGDLGFFGRGMLVKPFEDAAFKLKEGEISDVIESEFGFHIIRVTGIKAAQVKPFEQVRTEIEREYRQQQAQKKFAEAAEQFTNTVYEQSDSLKPAAEKLKLAVQTVDRLTRDGLPARPGAPQIFTPRVVQALFSDDGINKKRNTEAIEVAANAFVSARVVEHRPAALRPLAEVRDAIKVRVERQEASRQAREAAQKALAVLRQAQSDAGFSPTTTVSRAQPQGLPQTALAAIMRAPADKLPVYVDAELDGGSYGIFRVLTAKMPETPNLPQREAFARAVTQQAGAADDLAYLDALKTKHKAEVLKTDLRPTASSGRTQTDGKKTEGAAPAAETGADKKN
jgi:peptidyl-prolyl cis-trans isomerase D